MNINYDGQEYIIDNICASMYKIHNSEICVVVVMEWKSGSYFKIQNIYNYKNNRTYSAQKYFYKWIPICREATYKIAQEVGLWDYTENTLRKLA